MYRWILICCLWCHPIAHASDGLLDAGFGNGGHVVTPFNLGGQNQDQFPSSVVDSLGRTVSVAEVNTANGYRIAMLRLLPDGSADASFAVDGKRLLSLTPFVVPQRAPRLLRLPDGKFLLLVRLEISGADFDIGVCRLFVAGNLDTGFSGDGCIQFGIDLPGGGLDYPQAIGTDADGKVLIAGHANAGAIDSGFVARLTASGALDGSFNGSGKQVLALSSQQSTRLHDVAVLSTGRILAVGSTVQNGKNNTDILLVRLLATGVIDNSYVGAGFRRIAVDLFGPDAAFANDRAYAMYVAPGSDVVTLAGMAGVTAASDAALLVRVLPAGALDNGFASGGLFGTAGEDGINFFNDLQVDESGRIYALGSAPRNGNTDLLLARLSASGSLDAGFGSSGRMFLDIGPQKSNVAGNLVVNGGQLLISATLGQAGLDADISHTRVLIDAISGSGFE